MQWSQACGVNLAYGLSEEEFKGKKNTLVARVLTVQRRNKLRKKDRRQQKFRLKSFPTL